MATINVNGSKEQELVTVEIVSGKWKSDSTKEWKGVKLTIGDWSTLVFPKSRFELEHIESILNDKV